MHFFLILFRLLYVHDNSAEVVYYLYSGVFLLFHLVGRQIIRSAPRRLTQRKKLVEADLQVKTAGLRKLGGVGALYHVLAVRFFLHFKAHSETRVAPDLVVYHAAGLLRRENKVHAQTSAYSRGAYQLLHKFGLLRFQLCKLV